MGQSTISLGSPQINLTNAGALGTNGEGQLISVTPGGGGTSGYPANQPVSGCGVEYVSGLTFTVGACTYTIGGAQYNSPLAGITLDSADATNPRIDVIAVDSTGVAIKITGTPAATPAQPTVDYSTQLPLNLVLIPTMATTPSGIVATQIYIDNAEWTCANSSNINCNSTSNPYAGTKDIEATAAVSGNNFTLTKPMAGTVDLSTQNTLTLYIRSKATWPTANGSGSSGLRTLSLFWLNGSTQVGVQVVIRSGAFGFDSSVTSAYQQITIPVTQFATGANAVTTLKGQISGNGGTSSIGFYIDQVTLQSGNGVISLPATLVNYKGTWNGTANYNQNDLVVSGNVGYVALSVNTNQAVTVASIWQKIGGSQTVASGAKALDTDAIASEGCDTMTDTATGAVSTDIVVITANADITAVTGYAPETTGGLAIYTWLTANTLNIKVCNPTSGSITPGAVTLNWKVIR